MRVGIGRARIDLERGVDRFVRHDAVIVARRRGPSGLLRPWEWISDGWWLILPGILLKGETVGMKVGGEGDWWGCALLNED